MNAKTKRIGLIGFSLDAANIFKTEGLDIAAHIYSNETQKKKTHKDNKASMNFHSWKSYSFSKPYNSSLTTEEIAEAREMIFDEFIKCTDRWPWSSELVNNWNDYNHLFVIACNQCAGWLDEHKIKNLVFSNVPHQGVALALFAISKLKGIKTYMFLQSPFAGRSFLIEDWKDIGIFKTSKAGLEFNVDITPPIQQPFYMASVKGKTKRKIRNKLAKLRAQTIVSLGLTGLNKNNRQKSFKRNTKRWQNAVEDSRYMIDAEKAFSQTPINEKYIYFPLHLQPEMTTDILGGEFSDQLLALETLRQIVPDEIAIYVKENPKQTGQLRSQSFFDRLTKIPNIKLLSKDISSFELTSNSIAVSTISGTAGWEALRIGKPVIVFGSVFWNQFPGAFHISKSFKWQDIETFDFKPKALQKSANYISTHAHEGISDLVYAAQVENFDDSKNTAKLASIISSYL